MTPTITDPATAPTVAPVVGKRALLRNGEITPPLKGDVEAVGYNTFWAAYVDIANGGETAWTSAGAFKSDAAPHELDIIAILDDGAAPDPQIEAEVAQFDGYKICGMTFSAKKGMVCIASEAQDPQDTMSFSFSPGIARALLSVLPALIKIAEER